MTTSSNVSWYAGTSLSLTCDFTLSPSVDTSPATTVSWRVSGTAVNISSHRISASEKSLTFSPLATSDSGSYTCEVIVAAQEYTAVKGPGQSAAVDIIVATLPSGTSQADSTVPIIAGGVVVLVAFIVAVTVIVVVLLLRGCCIRSARSSVQEPLRMRSGDIPTNTNVAYVLANHTEMGSRRREEGRQGDDKVATANSVPSAAQLTSAGEMQSPTPPRQQGSAARNGAYENINIP